MDKTGRYEMLAEPFHCDFQHRLHLGHLGNHMLNAADYHSTERDFGMNYLNTIGKTWVLSRLAIEMEESPRQGSRFLVETWVESAMRYFTKRNFRVEDKATGKTLGYGRSIWALIDLDSRQPTDILSVRDGDIMRWVESEKPCPMAAPGRVKVSPAARLTMSERMRYSDIDINSHVNSVKYIEHILNAFPLDYYRAHTLRRLDIAYVAETHCGDTLNIYVDDISEKDKAVRVTRTNSECDREIEVTRCALVFN